MQIRALKRSARVAAATMLLHVVAAAAAGATISEAPLLDYRVVAQHPHDATMYTEGLLFLDGDLYESAGRYGRSRLCRVELQSGKPRRCAPLPGEFFGEGIAAVGTRLLQLTWRENTGLVYDRELQPQARFRYAGEGWGLTYDGKHLLMSDGGAALRVLDPASYRELGRIPVTEAGKPLSMLNELEYARGLVWANLWHSDQVVAIDAASGEVRARLDLGALRARWQRPLRPGDDETSLNGIAYDARGDRFFFTGKDWPWLFELAIGSLPAQR